MDHDYDLGNFSFPVTHASEAAQLWFDRGLLWTIGYNHGQALACFEQAIEADPACAMAHWGVAPMRQRAGLQPALAPHGACGDARAKALAAAHAATAGRVGGHRAGPRRTALSRRALIRSASRTPTPKPDLAE